MHPNQRQASWADNLNKLLARLPLEERHLCAAGIPGPMMELRSGALPVALARGVGIKDYVPLIADVTGLDKTTLRTYSKQIATRYSLPQVCNRMSGIAADAASRLTLLYDIVQGIVRRYRGRGTVSNPAATTRHVRLRLGNGVVPIEYPANLVSVGLIWEIFCEEAYRISDPVERIYDFGANTGLAALYFAALHPGAELVCVEPLDENFAVLRRNIERNHVNARLICAAAGPENGNVDLSFSDQSHALPSVHARQALHRSVPMVRFDQIVQGANYGLKIDIEGSESGLAAFPQIVCDARWIVGELHYTGDESHDSSVDEFFGLVTTNFVVTKSRPTIYFVDDEVMLCQSFKAIKSR